MVEKRVRETRSRNRKPQTGRNRGATAHAQDHGHRPTVVVRVSWANYKATQTPTPDTGSQGSQERHVDKKYLGILIAAFSFQRV